MPENIDLLIIADAGSNQYDEHKEILEMGIKTLVLDHHLTDKYSEYAVVVNNQLSANYPNKDLCGAGVVYKFMQYYDKKYGYDFAEDDIDLIAIAEVSDMMGLQNLEVRNICFRGLNHIKNDGIRALVEKNSYSLNGRTKLTTIDVAFYIAPYINALVRVGTQEEKEILFLSLIDGSKKLQSTKRGAKPGDIELAGEQMARLATNAKARQQRLIDAALQIVEGRIEEYDLLQNKILLVKIKDRDNIPQTITGLVAMKLTAKYHKPTLLLRECEDGVLKGSIRCEGNTKIGGFKSYLDGTKYLEYVLGHEGAAGAGLAEAKLESFLDYTNNDLAEVDFAESYYKVDYIIGDKDDLSDAVLQIGAAGIWGQELAEPLFAANKLCVKKDDVTLMKSDSLKFTHGGITYTMFKNPQACKDFTQYDRMSVSLVGKANVNEWCGHITPQIFIDNYEIKNYDREF